MPWAMQLAQVPYQEIAAPRWYMVFLGNLQTVWQGGGPSSHNLAVLWSVAIEEQFYLVWPVLLMVLFRQWRLGAFMAVVALSVWFRSQHLTDHRHTLGVISDMALGGAAAWASFRSLRFQRWVAGWSRLTIAGIYAAGVLVILAEKTVFSHHPWAIALARLPSGLIFCAGDFGAELREAFVV
ncbi:MAG: hypothetical protein NVS3B25_31100 [Hymenobacter sp.]